MRKMYYLILFIAVAALVSCTAKKNVKADALTESTPHLEWTRNAVIYEVNLRQYTTRGTLKAFEEQLPQLKELGVDILWFMPVYPVSELNRKGTLGSYYAVRNYKDINPEYGTLADFKQMVDKAHKLGFKVILDWVANHTGCDNVWIKEHPDWYLKDSLGKFIAPFDWTDVYKLDYSKKEMRAAMLDALKFWVKEYDVDGFRCDVAFQVPTDFWENARPELEAIKPVFMLAEAETPELTRKAFDMDYDWKLHALMNKIAKGEKNAKDLDLYLAEMDTLYAPDVYKMEFVTNHDENTWNGSEYERMGDGVKAFAVLTYTLKGMPLIYTGQEVGMKKRLEFFEKDTVPSWTKNETFAFYQKMNALKHSQPALAAGDKGGKLIRYQTESPETFVYERNLSSSSQVLVYLNLSSKPVQLKFKDKAPNGEYTDYFKGKNTPLPTSLGAWEYKIFIRE